MGNLFLFAIISWRLIQLCSPLPQGVTIASYDGTTAESEAEAENAKHCIIYMPPLVDDRLVSSNQCQEFCKDVEPDENGLKSVICAGFWPEGGPSPYIDDPDREGGKLMRGDCQCNNAFLNFIVHEVLEALPAIAQIGCNLLMAAFQFIVNLALAATRIGTIVDAAMTMGIEAAKTLAYAYDVDAEAIEEFTNWASFCGTDRLPGDMGKVFSVLRDVEDALVGFRVPKGLTPEGGGKGKGGYGKCKQKRSGDGKALFAPRLRIADDPFQDDNCKKDDDKKDPDATKITKSEPKLKTIVKTCDGQKYPQACGHYLSAVEVHKAGTIFTCSDSNERTDAVATDDWTKEHKNKKWQEYTVDPAMECDADEYPPGYFWDRGKTTGQIVRWIPAGQNRGVASANWGGFCKKEDGGEGNGQLDKDGNVNKDLVKLGDSKVEKKNGKETTNYEATFTRAVFKMEFDNNVPGKNDDYGIPDNPCWPKYIVPDDAGYCLLSDDPWYEDKDEATNHLWEYNQDPDDETIKAADKRRSDDGGQTKRDLQLIDGVLAVREANLTRRLTDDELAHEIEIIPCSGRTCAKERRDLRSEEGILVMEGEKLLEPREALAVESFVPRAVPILNDGVLRRDLLPRLPVVTNLAVVGKRADDGPGIPPLTRGPS